MQELTCIHHDDEVGTASPWAPGWDAISSLGTVGAVVAALVIWRLDIRRQRRTEAARVSARARSISGFDNNALVIVANRAASPAYDVIVERIDSDAEPLRFALLAPDEEERFATSGDMLKPGQLDSLTQ
ncbi:hypothetical protein [Myceligenerans salitolerans]|uniref:Uncharacterized protein n=1 Tax=Myceligenerans salitolerans TaxID=1230528 RepID=A0ABS3IDQ3_9MICO|nr:hypothetical protein [Myceligenerans salitolerans]MBO0611109.1 hypothetical protein [Myceligenerans salitolerans]